MITDAPCPYHVDPKEAVATFGDDRDGVYRGWISIAGEWVRLEPAEVTRLMKKHTQAQQLRLQYEAERSK